MTSPETLFDVSGIRARIHILPERLPFLTGGDVAEIYGTEYRRLTEAVKRNRERFPSDFAFHLEPQEAERLPQNAATSPGKRADLRPLVFTHIGAYALSGVLKTPVAAQMSVVIHRAFAEQEARALREAKRMLLKLRTEVGRKPIYVWIKNYVEAGFSFEQLWRDTNYSRPKLEVAAREMLAQGLIPHLPSGMQPGLFDNV